MARKQVKEVKDETLNAIRARLEKLCERQPKRKRTRKSAIEQLSPQINVLLGRGFTIPEIADQFKQEGLLLSAGTLRSYLSRSRSGRKQAAAQKGIETQRDVEDAVSIGAGVTNIHASEPERESCGKQGGSEVKSGTGTIQPVPASGVADAVALLRSKKSAMQALPKRGSFFVVADTEEI
ncbi:MAG: hypothetical protein P4L10_03700 [Acidobacteriaceae bacterium]|nr:hypothetical protein [Acidobacteriaceae bacterium]